MAGTLAPVTLHVAAGGTFTSNVKPFSEAFQDGAKQFSDRDYTLAHVPSALDGLRYYRGPCHVATSTSISLTSSRAMAIYVISSNGNNAAQSNALSTGLISAGFKTCAFSTAQMTTTSWSSSTGFRCWEAKLLAGHSLSFTTDDVELTILEGPGKPVILLCTAYLKHT